MFLSSQDPARTLRNGMGLFLVGYLLLGFLLLFSEETIRHPWIQFGILFLGMIGFATLVYVAHCCKRQQTRLQTLQSALEDATLRLRVDPPACSDSADRFQAFMDHSPAVGFINSAGGRLLFLNEEGQRVFGFQGTGEYAGKKWDEVVAPAIAAQLRHHEMIVLSSGVPQRFLETIPTADGLMREWLVLRFPFRTELGSAFTGGIALDLTEQRWSERRLGVQQSVATLFNACTTTEQAAPLFLAAVGSQLGWDVGEWWQRDEQGHLQRAFCWHNADSHSANFLITTMGLLPKTSGHLERLWAERQPIWVEQLVAQEEDEHSTLAVDHGLTVLASFPIVLSGQMLGLCTFLRRATVVGSQDVLRTMKDLGCQFGQFVQRRKSEVALREQEVFLRAVIDNSVDGIIVIDEWGRVEVFNAKSEALFGYKSAEVVGQDVNLLINEGQRRQHSGYLERARMSRQPVRIQAREVHAQRKDGSQFPIELSISEMEVARRRKFIGIMHDVSAARRAEHELAEVNAHLEAVLNGATQVSIIATDVQGIINVFNCGAENLLGYLAEEIVGMQTPLAFHLPEEIQERARELQITLGYPVSGFQVIVELVRKQEFEERIWTYVRKDGVHLSVHLVVTALRTPQGIIRGFLGIARDVTAQRQAEAERERYLMDVEMARDRIEAQAAELATQTEELHLARATAESASRAKSDFLAHMSHEIRTPINGIIGMTHLALESELTTEQRDYLDTVKKSGEHLLSVINDILDFSKIEAGKLDLDPQPFLLREELADTLNTLAIRAHAKGLELAWDAQEDVPEAVIGDANRLRQLVLNLVGNAIKFTDYGEVLVRVSVDERWCPVAPNQVSLHFAISDTGIGIPEEHCARIFAPFEQADLSTTRKFGGTGLGLSICARLVEIMSGAIWVESQLGHGSQFHFTVCLERGEPAQKNVSPVLQGAQVLIVEDHEATRTMLARICSSWGMVPRAFSSGPAALTYFEENPGRQSRCAVALVDLQMPEMSGLILIERFRVLLGPMAPTPLILHSTVDSLGNKLTGVVRVLTKPIKLSVLRKALEEELCPSLKTLSPEPVARPTQSARHLSVLVADDNEVNRKLLLCLLEKWGHVGVLAENGRVALEQIQRMKFDVVLMDLSMPIMDGFEATAALRASEQGTGRHLPVIALTAHAKKEDQNLCMVSGMDGYLTKPIQPNELRKLMERITESAAQEPTALPPVAPSQEARKIFDRVGCLERIGGDEEFLTELIGLFLDQLPSLLQEIRDLIEKEDRTKLVRVAHTLKGSASNMGAIALAQEALELEEACRQSANQDLHPWIALLEDRVEELQLQMFPATADRPNATALAS